jgi:hypothetical protein
MRPRDVIAPLEESIGLTGSPVRLRSAIERVLLESFGLLPIQAAEKAELYEEEVKDLVAEREETNPFPRLALVSSAEHLVAGYCYISPSDRPEIAAAKRSRLNFEPLLREIRSLTFQQFEQFGACVLRELGARPVKVTSHSEDQGIDFYGILSLGRNSVLPSPFGQLAHDVRLRFAGQAKHYPTRPIGPEMIRELVGSIALARHKVFTANEEMFDDLELLPFNPLVAVFFTTGRFTGGATELAEKSGVIAKSGEQLAVFLADRGIGMNDDNGVMKFDKTRFHHWLSTP